MIEAERFLQERGLQPAKAETEGPFCAVDGDDGAKRERMPFADGEHVRGASRRSRHARHAGRVANGVVCGSEETRDRSHDIDACREAALRLLDAAPRPSGALISRLLDKGYASETVEDVIERLIRVQLVDDEAYAHSAVRHCAARMMGRRGAVMELVRKGVDRRLAQMVCDEAEADGVFSEAAWELGRRTARRTAGLDAAVRKRRFWSAGGRKGHNPEVLREVARELF